MYIYIEIFSSYYRDSVTHSLLCARCRNGATASDPCRGPAPPGGRTAAEQPLPGCYFGLGFRGSGFSGV